MERVFFRITEKSNNSSLSKQTYSEKNMPLDSFTNLVNKIPDTVGWVYLIGGDPLTLNNLNRYISTASEKFKVSLVTDCSVKPKNLSKKLSKVFVILKYPDENLHDKWNRNEGSYSYLVEILTWCKENGIPSTIIFEMDSQNYIYLLRVHKLCREYGSYLHLIRMLPYSEETKFLWLQDDKFSKSLKDSQNKWSPLTTWEHHDSTISNCDSGVKSMNICPDGSVTISPFIEIVVGNLTDDSFNTLQKKCEIERVKYSGCTSCPCIVERKNLFFPLEKVDELVRFENE